MSAQVDTATRDISAEPEASVDLFVKIMSRDSDSEEVLKEAFKVLNEMKTGRPEYVFRSFMKRIGVELTLEEVHETISQVENRQEKEKFDYEDFIEIIKLLKKPTVMDQLKKMYEALVQSNTKPFFVLYGESGVGKTWMARKIADHAIREGDVDVALWIYLDRIYDVSSLQESFVYQLSKLPTIDELQAEKDNKDESIKEALRGKRLLLILDDEGSKMKVHADLDKKELFIRLNGGRGINLYEILALDESCKYLITRRTCPTSDEFGMMVMPLTRDEANDFVKDGTVKDLADTFIGKSRRFPNEVLIISKTLSYYGESEARLRKLQNDLEKLEKDKKDGMSFKDLETLLISGYERLPRSVLVDCFSSETLEGHFLTQGKMVIYNELISYWIMEGHLGHFDRIEDAYEEGHRVLMELLDCGLLKNQEAGCVVSSGKKFDFDVHERYKFFRSIRLGLATTFDSKLGRVEVKDGTIRTSMSSGQKETQTLTLMLDGNYIGGGNFVSDGEIGNCENLAMFNPTGKYLPLSTSKMPKLRLLVFRGCEFLGMAEKIFNFDKSLENLTVFEISGPSRLNKLPDDLFTKMPNLKNLNLSFLQIESLPESLYQLTKLVILILRGCSSLKKLGTLKNLKDLEVLDISGSISLDSIVDKSFSKNRKLRIINLSESRIETLPLIHFLLNLNSLSLRDCAPLLRVRRSRSLERLHVLDVSGAVKVEEFLDPSLEGLKSIDFLDISRTAVNKLPSNVGDPLCLYLRDCMQIEKLTAIEGLSRIEVLDLSGSRHLDEIRIEFFKNVKSLRELNLSKTKVKELTFLSRLNTLRKLFLSQCPSLVDLENLSELEELEILDISGCENLETIKYDSFEKMSRLHYLDVSGLIKLTQLPSLSKLVSLKELFVKNCRNLTELLGVHEISSLETLDHSGTCLKPSPSFHPDSLKVLSVLGPIFVSDEDIDPKRLLEDLGAINISESTHHEHKQEGSGQVCNWRISNWRGEQDGHKARVSGVRFLRLLKMHPSLLRENFKNFNFLVYPSETPENLPEKYYYWDEIGLRDAYLSQVTTPEEFKWRLEIRGFNNVPTCVEHLLQESEFIVLIDDSFLKSLHSLAIDAVKNMKACWIERCTEMEHVIGENNLNNLEILWISDVKILKSIFSSSTQNLKSLKSLTLEHCPNLTTLCSSASQLENLETLIIKHCQKLDTLFHDDSAKLDSLTALHLWGLPELKKVACMAQSLTALRVGECPLLENIFTSAPDRGNLETLHVKFCDKLSAIFEAPADLPMLKELEAQGLPKLEKIGCTTPRLKSLKIAECPLLESVVDLDWVSESLKVVEVKCCEKVRTVVKKGGEIAGRSLEVDTMELLCLPEVKSIGVKVVNMETCIIWGCPKLKNPK